MSILKQGVFILAAKRTPFGAYGGKLLGKSCTDIAEIAAQSCITNSEIPATAIDSVIFGNIVQSNKDTAYLPRHVGLRIGVHVSTPAFAVNRMCGSGFQAVISAAQEIISKASNIVLAGGSEHMSAAPFTIRDIRFGTRHGVDVKLEDTIWETLFDHHVQMGMGSTAEHLAHKYGITREQCDAFALLSQVRWMQAQSDGVFTDELTPIELKDKKGNRVIFNTDECPRKTDLDQLAKLKPVFLKNGVVTAGNASGISDGAAALLIASEEAVAVTDVKPLARIVGYAVAGCDPSLMGIGPVVAIDKLMRAVDPSKSGRDVASYCDLVEVNEAFAAQYLAVEKELGLDRDRTNVHGGAIAIGHPVGATGSRILAHLTHQLANSRNGPSRRAVGSACIGGGQGIAVMIESV